MKFIIFGLDHLPVLNKPKLGAKNEKKFKTWDGIFQINKAITSVFEVWSSLKSY